VTTFFRARLGTAVAATVAVGLIAAGPASAGTSPVRTTAAAGHAQAKAHHGKRRPRNHRRGGRR
jgi:hypothetical protein